MLRLYVPAVANRVYPPGIRRDAQMPRITLQPLTPTEIRTGIGERFGSYQGLYYVYTFRVDVWDKDPNKVETTCDQVLYAVWKHRGYIPTSAYSTYGEFILLEISGGSTTEMDAPTQLYRRTLNVRGRWLSRSTELF
jgi:hypothetical protein